MNRSTMLDILGYDHGQIVADRLRTMDEFIAINAEVNKVTHNTADEWTDYIAMRDAMLSE